MLRKPAHELPALVRTNAVGNTAGVRDRVEWVVMLGQQSRALATKNALGVFGTSIAATWLQEELGGKAAFFVDEDPSRHGQHSWGARSCVPVKSHPDARVLIQLPTPMAEQVRARLMRQAPNVNWLVPPPLPG